MATVSEKGHAINAAHFGEFLESIFTFNEKYKPGKKLLEVESMKTISADCNKAIADVAKAYAAFKASVDARELVYELMNRHVSRIMSVLKSSDVVDATVETCKSIVRKLQGRRATPRKSPSQISEDTATVREISSSQRSYDNQLGNFSLLVEQLLTTPGYAPNEADLQTKHLLAMIEDMKQKNAAVVAARSALKDARAKRDELMYKKDSGMIDVALDAKAYIRGAFGPASSEFKKVQKLQFRKN